MQHPQSKVKSCFTFRVEVYFVGFYAYNFVTTRTRLVSSVRNSEYLEILESDMSSFSCFTLVRTWEARHPWLFISMGKNWKYTNKMRKNGVNQHKSGNDTAENAHILYRGGLKSQKRTNRVQGKKKEDVHMLFYRILCALHS